MRKSAQLLQRLAYAYQQGSTSSSSAALLASAQQQRFLSAAPLPQEDTSSTQNLNAKDGKVLHPELLNSAVLKTQYAVRGELYLRAEQLRQQGLPIVFTNGK